MLQCQPQEMKRCGALADTMLDFHRRLVIPAVLCGSYSPKYYKIYKCEATVEDFFRRGTPLPWGSRCMQLGRPLGLARAVSHLLFLYSKCIDAY